MTDLLTALAFMLVVALPLGIWGFRRAMRTK
jgi:hypothetical protein